MTSNQSSCSYVGLDHFGSQRILSRGSSKTIKKHKTQDKYIMVHNSSKITVKK